MSSRSVRRRWSSAASMRARSANTPTFTYSTRCPSWLHSSRGCAMDITPDDRSNTGHAAAAEHAEHDSLLAIATVLPARVGPSRDRCVLRDVIEGTDGAVEALAS